MKQISLCAILSGLALSACADTAPFPNTVYFEPDVITADDPSAFRSVTYIGKIKEPDYSNNCDEEFAGDDFYLFEAGFTRGQTVAFYIDRKFASERAAQDITQIYAPILGQMPYLLRRGVDVVIVRAENENWCASTGQIEIEHGQYRSELADGALEESMMHETVHTTLDDVHADAIGWRKAQATDSVFVSEYAEELPDDEDLAETFTAYYGILQGRLTPEDEAVLLTTIPARLEYLQQNFPQSALSIE